MFKKEFTAGAKTKLKSSAQRAIRNEVCEIYPLLAPYIDDVIPKKDQLDTVKLPDRVTLFTHGSQPKFWRHMDDPLIPHLSLVHQYPTCFTRLRVDRGAIRFVLSGATLMVPGFTSNGGRLPDASREGKSEEEDPDVRYGSADLEAGKVVVIEAEGKEHACSVGILKVGTKEMKEVKKGVGVELGHYLGDGLWKLSLD